MISITLVRFDRRGLMGWYDFQLAGADTHKAAWAAAGAASAFASVLTGWLVCSHLQNYRRPQRQRYIIRILWMIPIYAILSFLSLCFNDQTLWFDVPRDLYEAYILYNFFSLCIEYMGGDAKVKEYFSRQQPLQYLFPFSCFGNFDMTFMLETCRFFILQYCIIKPCVALTTLVLAGKCSQDAPHYTAYSIYLWLVVAENVSVTLALYFLLAFYRASRTNTELAKGKPFGKFLAVKVVVFFCFWQTLIVDILGSLGIISSSLGESNQITVSFSDFLICLEMAIISVLHTTVFSASEHQWGYYELRNNFSNRDGLKHTEKFNFHAAFLHVISVEDVCADCNKMARSCPALFCHSWAVMTRWCGFKVTLHKKKKRRTYPAELSPQEFSQITGSKAVEDSLQVQRLRWELARARSAEDRMEVLARLSIAEHFAEASSPETEAYLWGV